VVELADTLHLGCSGKRALPSRFDSGRGHSARPEVFKKSSTCGYFVNWLFADGKRSDINPFFSHEKPCDGKMEKL